MTLPMEQQHNLHNLQQPHLKQRPATASKEREGRSPLRQALMWSIIIALGLLSLSVFQSQMDPVLQKGYGILAFCTSGLLALHHSLIH